ncbi:Hsp70 family protein [Terrabacter sp. MAHUQ-38]|uniref:Hsp70 family protein n=1 Tax=unclassified Terrabacter TaxID=2630222 RepID=UPI00165E2722|nr:Hsp70 family protein [Terrabacter sp. MAHUQ-38]MBC9820538.1 Hsp70 family protein [Terrabacter sp. MAHUQ-38]
MSDRYVLAIDFGTSNTCASIRRGDGAPTTLRLGYSTNAMPSAVLLRGDELLVGDDASRLAGLDPAAFERTPKRRLGPPSMLLGGTVVDPVDLVAAVLRRTLDAARMQSRGAAPDSVVITHPAAWGAHLTALLLEAATRAGADPDTTSLLPEPLAAAWRHAAGGAVSSGERLAVVDFGGGTFDVAHLRAAGNGNALDIIVGDFDGIDPLGGDDFDGYIERWVREQLAAEGRQDLLEALDSDEGLAARLTTRDEITRAKHALSHHASAPVLVTVAGERAVVTLTAAEFEAMIGPSVARAVETTRRLLAGAPVDHLFLTGGSSLIPLVQREFQAVSGGRVGTLGDPKEVTSLGALLAPVASPASTPPPSPPRPAPPAAPPPAPPVEQLPGHAAARTPKPVHLSADAALTEATNATAPPRRRSRLRVASIVGALLLAAVLGSVWVGGRDGAPTAGRTTGSSSVAETSTSETTTSTGETSTGETSGGETSTTAEPPFDCADLTTDECALARSRQALVQSGSCTPWDGAPEAHAIRCTPRSTDVAVDGSTWLYLFTYDTVSELRKEADAYFTDLGTDPSRVTNTDLTHPPAVDTWAYGKDAPTEGRVYAHFSDSKDVARLMWTYEDDLALAYLVSTGGNIPNLVQWWGST